MSGFLVLIQGGNERLALKKAVFVSKARINRKKITIGGVITQSVVNPKKMSLHRL